MFSLHTGNMTVENANSIYNQEYPDNVRNVTEKGQNGNLNEFIPLQDETDKCQENGRVITIETRPRQLTYRISETPPILLTLFFAFQQAILSLPSGVITVALVAEFICARDLETLKARMLCSTLLLSGICTFLQVTIGIRLPLFQGPAKTYIIPLLALATLPEWQCPAKSGISREDENSTSPINVTLDNQQITEDTVYYRLQLMQGALIAAGLVHMFAGLTGLVGYLMRFIGPITILPTILLIGLSVYSVVVKFCETHWGISMTTAIVCLVLSLYLGRVQMPVLVWTRKRGFHIIRYPLHQVFSILAAIVVGWSLSAILSALNVLSSDPNSIEFYARSDTRLSVISETPTFLLPFPGQYGKTRFSFGIFLNFMSATIVSIIDSIGDYYACAKISRVPPPPIHAVNRGLFIEGFCSALAGVFGCGHATTTYGGTIGAIGITKVASRRVFQCFACILVAFSIIGKFGAVFITIPYAVIGGTQILGIGMFIGLVMSNMQYIDMSSTRNLAIIGISILVGLMIPHWTKNNPNVINTGYSELDSLVKVLMTSPNIAGGILAFILDNTVPGTLEERGLLTWGSGGGSDDDLLYDLEENSHVYEVAKVSKWLKKFGMSKYIPIFPQYEPKNMFKNCKSEKKI